MDRFMTCSSDIRSIEDLRRAQRAGRDLEYVFFPDGGSLADPPTASCLSQWATAPFVSGGLEFRSAEQAMMHGKAMLFGDAEMAGRILAARTPYQAKILGAQVRGFSEEAWIRRRFDVVVSANLPKFATNPVLMAYLLSTGGAILAEASPTDRVWGTGLDEFDRDARDPAKWPGLSLLGFALMEVRDRLVEGS
jgi:ribA/ribD-fused uncharacterized protein